jgi:K+-transporting ATPase ATPase C chain
MTRTPHPSNQPAPAEGVIAEIVPAVLMTLALTLVTGVLYPLLVTAIAQLAFPHQANGSLIVRQGHVVGSSWIGQQFDDPKYFWSRISASSPPYNAAASSGSNEGPLNPALVDAAKSRIAALRAADPAATGPVPVDLVTASGSGLDPHISVAAAEYQMARVARMRGVDVAIVRAAMARHTSPRFLGVIGEPAVNVLELNLALDDRQTR